MSWLEKNHRSRDGLTLLTLITITTKIVFGLKRALGFPNHIPQCSWHYLHRLPSNSRASSCEIPHKSHIGDFCGCPWHTRPTPPMPPSLAREHYNDVIMGTMASKITSLTIVYFTVYSDTDQRKHQSSTSLAFVRGIHRWPVNSPHKWPVTRKMFLFDDVIMNKTASHFEKNRSETH